MACLRLIVLLLLFPAGLLAQEYRYFPQIGDGTVAGLRFQTSFFFVNTGNDAEISLEIRNGEGGSLPLELQPYGKKATFEFSIPAGHTVVGITPGTDALQVGYSRFQAPETVTGTAVFTGTDEASGTILFEAGVPATSAQANFTVVVDSRGAKNTGLAIVSAVAGSADPEGDPVTVTLFDKDYNEVARKTERLQPGGKIAKFVDEFFSGNQVARQEAAEMVGSLSVVSPVPVAAVTLRQILAEPFPAEVPVLTAFPVAPGSAQQREWQLVWADEFDGPTIDASKWEHQVGDGCPSLCSWGNNELEYYTARPENSRIESGKLIIEARKETYQSRTHTSARLRTKNKGDWEFGRFEIRAKLLQGKGLWPAFWMLPTDEVYGSWAASGEIDIMEMLGQEPDRVYGTLHYGGEWPKNVSSGSYFVLGIGDFSQDFHVFALEWEPGKMRWYVDGILYQTQERWHSSQAQTPAPFPAPFDQRFHLLLNLAVGGNWPGYPDPSVAFPKRIEIDYVRVYQKSE